MSRFDSLLADIAANAKAHEAERWGMGARIRFTIEGPDGALYLLEDAKEGRLLRLTPAK